MRTLLACLIVSGSLAPLTAQEPGRLTPEGVSPAVHGVVELPDTPGPHPGVVIVPGARGWRPIYPAYARTLADSGFAALALDYYGETGREASPADRAVKRPVWLQTIRNAVEYLRSTASEGQPVGLLGFSRGGFLVVDVGRTVPGVEAVVEWFGVGAADPDVLREQVDGLPPLLILHGAADSVVAVDQAYRLRDAVLDRDGEVEWHVYPEGDHGFATQPGALDDASRRTIAFLRRHLRPDPD